MNSSLMDRASPRGSNFSPASERRDRFVADLTSQDILHRLAQDIDALLDLQSGQDQRRCDLEHVPPVARVVDDQSELPGAVDDFGGGRLVRLARGAVFDQLDALDHAQAANIANDLDIAESVDQALMYVAAQLRGLLNEVEPLDLVQHRQTGGTTGGVASGGEERGASGRIKHLSPRNDGAQWHSTPKRLAKEN